MELMTVPEMEESKCMRIVIGGSEFIANGWIINLLRDYFYFGH